MNVATRTVAGGFFRCKPWERVPWRVKSLTMDKKPFSKRRISCNLVHVTIILRNFYRLFIYSVTNDHVSGVIDD
jgi:hypothetical protein